MKHLKALGLASVSAMALMAFTAGSASATTLEVGGATTNSSVTIEASLASGTGVAWLRTDLTVANTCWSSSVAGSTSSPFTGTTVTGPVSSMTFTECTRPVTVHKAGTLHVQHTGTTNGTVSSSGTEVTVGSPFGTLNCKTGAGVDIGTLTGTASGHATIDLKAVMNCGFLVPSALWGGTYVITSPTGLGVSA